MYYLFIFGIPTAYLLRYAMETLITISTKRWKRILMLFGLWLLSDTVIFIGDITNISLAIPFFLFCILLSCEGSFYKKIAIGLIFSSTVFSFNALRDNYMIDSYARLTDREFSLFFLHFSSLLFSVFLYIATAKFAPDKNYELSDGMWKLLLLLTATPIGIVLSIVILYNMSNDNNYSTLYAHQEYAVLLTIALLSFIGLFLAISVLARQQELNHQLMIADINQSYYESMEQQHFEIRRLKHDMANHLQILLALPDEKRTEYIQSLAENTAVTQTLHYCGDATINAVLSVKESLMNRYHIEMQWNIDIPSELPFEKKDVCALFANALDNAVEACMKLEEKERKIILESKTQKGLFCLRITNPTAPIQDNNLLNSSEYQDFPSTSKQDKTKHGLGFKSMHETVTRYHGSLSWKTEAGVFELFLYMPLNGM